MLRYLKWTFLSALSGLMAGIAAAIFLISLDWATKTRQAHQGLIWLLPVAGFFIGWVYHRYGKSVEKGNNLILDEIHAPQRIVPLRMAPFVLFGTLLTHLFGGSAGREGTAVQMGASLSDQLSKLFKIENDERKILLVAGAGAGFGAAIGAPWAGVIFGMEVIHIGRLRLFAPLECFVASFVAFYTAVALGAPHSTYPAVMVPAFSWSMLAAVVAAGMAFGLAARVFTAVTHAVEAAEQKLISYPPLKPLLAGIVIVALYWFEGTYRYAGLGIETIQKALLSPASLADPAWKLLLTALTVGSGFKGGEFIPLVFIGATLGSALSVWLPASLGLLAALGFAAVFGAAANTPVACTVMAMELFGPRLGAYAALACVVSYYFSGHRGIYRSQPVKDRK